MQICLLHRWTGLKTQPGGCHACGRESSQQGGVRAEKQCVTALLDLLSLKLAVEGFAFSMAFVNKQDVREFLTS